MTEMVGIWCRIRQASDRAVMVEADDGRTHWLPLSQIGDLPDQRHWQSAVLLDVPAWLAEREGMV